MQKQLRARATYDAPNVLLISKGTYEDEFYIGPEKLHLYLSASQRNARSCATARSAS